MAAAVPLELPDEELWWWFVVTVLDARYDEVLDLPEARRELGIRKEKAERRPLRAGTEAQMIATSSSTLHEFMLVKHHFIYQA